VTSYKTKAQNAAEVIRDRIRHGVYASGQRLDVDEIASDLAMSATPVREALSELQAESFVLNWPHRGSFVADFSPNETAALYDLRVVLEGHAVEVAARWLTDEDLSNLEDLQERLTAAFRDNDLDLAMALNEEWHMNIYMAATSAPHIFDFINRLWNDPRSSLSTIPGHPELAQSDHSEILEALRARDGERASALMRVHILNGKNLVLYTPAPNSASVPVK